MSFMLIRFDAQTTGIPLSFKVNDPVKKSGKTKTKIEITLGAIF